jgi:hypothetical protein
MVCLSGVSVPAWAASLDFSDWGFGTATPDQVRRTMHSAFPASRIIRQGEKIVARKAALDGTMFDVQASFSAKEGKFVLANVVLVLAGAPASGDLQALLQGYERASGGAEVYKKAPLDAIVSTAGNQTTITVKAEPVAEAGARAPNNASADDGWDRAVTVMKWIAGIAAALLVLNSLQYILYWIAGAALGYIFGNWAVGLAIGVLVAVIHLLVAIFTPRHRIILDRSIHHSGNDVQEVHAGVQDVHAIEHSLPAFNPANGLPMIGGYGGVDIHGNTYGSSFNDPH